MVARVDSKHTKRGLDKTQRMVNEWNDIMFVAATNTHKVVLPKLLNNLARPAPKVKYPIAWTSERQRRAYFASNGFGHGIPYRRTGGATKAWRAALVRGQGAIVSKVTNPNSYLIYVRYTRPGTRSRIQQMHLNTGHQNANVYIDQSRREWYTVYPRNLIAERIRRKR